MPLLLALVLQTATSEAIANAQMSALAESLRIYEEVGGVRPSALGELLKKPEGAEFWPDGGVWWGALPKDPWGGDYRLAEGRICASRDGVTRPLFPAPSGRIVPPNDRVRKYYTAHMQLQVAAAAGYLRWIRDGVLPSSLEHFGPAPKDPWGKPYEIAVRGGIAVIRVADETLRYLQLEADEAGALQQAAFPPMQADVAKLVLASIARAISDDLADRRAARSDLARYGRPVIKVVEECLAKEKDDFARRWLTELIEALSNPEEDACWQRYTGGLFATIGPAGLNDDLSRCRVNLVELHRAQGDYAAKADMKPVNKPGAEFWSGVLKPDDPHLKCPCGQTYRGPVTPPATWSMEDPDVEAVVALCDDEAHDGTALILRKNGEVSEVSRRQPEFFEAFSKTKR